MARLIVCDLSGSITADIEAEGPLMREALEHEKAEPVIRCAVLLALSTLAEGGSWPNAALKNMSGFMESMRDRMRMRLLS